MNLKFSVFLLIVILFFLTTTTCKFPDVPEDDSSSDVDDRFSDNDSLIDHIPPAIPDENNFSFIVITDTHYNDSQLGYFEEIEENKDDWGISFIVVNGDIVQNGKKEGYELVKDDIEKTTLPVYPVIGNHDISNNGFKYYKKYFGRTIYDFKIGELHLIFLDTANGILEEFQKIWLENKLNKSDCKYKIIFSHYSPTAMEDPEETYYLIDLCEEYDVDYFVSGHQHKYDYKEIRETKYFIINKRSENSNSFMKISIDNRKLKYDFF